MQDFHELNSMIMGMDFVGGIAQLFKRFAGVEKE